MKIAILTDSNAGIDINEAKELGVHLAYTPIVIEEETFYQEDGLTKEKFYAELKSDKNITTSMPSPGDIMDRWDKLLDEGYEQIVYIPLSSGLSNSCHAAIQLSEEYDGKVQVVDNHRISVTMRQAVLDAIWMADNGKDAKKDYQLPSCLQTSLLNFQFLTFSPPLCIIVNLSLFISILYFMYKIYIFIHY